MSAVTIDAARQDRRFTAARRQGQRHCDDCFSNTLIVACIMPKLDRRLPPWMCESLDVGEARLTSIEPND
jgi:hypothetical protein